MISNCITVKLKQLKISKVEIHFAIM